ncbi:MAG TPA: VOC family protein [Actinomycetota bacterium]|nr:VOC family protein [Actinomycetota bacterium]
MLKEWDLIPTIPTKDIDKARRFYEDVLGFAPGREDPQGIEYRSGSTRFLLYPTEFAGTAQHTLLGWNVDDVETTVKELTNNGITFEQYDMPGIKTDANGIAETEGVKGAWFKDPDGNILAIGEFGRKGG